MGAWFGSRNVDVADEIDAIRSELGSITNRISRVAGAASDNVRSNLDQFRDRVPSTSEAQGRLTRTARDVMDRGSDLFGQANDGFQYARGSVEKNPMLGLAIAAGIGFLVGLSARR